MLRQLIAIKVKFRTVIRPPLRDKKIVKSRVFTFYRYLSVQLCLIIGCRVHPADSCLVKSRQLTLIVMGISMLIVSPTESRDSKSNIHCAGTYHMVAHVNRTAIHRAFLAGRMEEVNQLSRAGGNTA